MEAKIKVAILTISDRCSSGETEDLSGAALKKLIEDGSLFQGYVVDQKCCPDEKDKIQEALLEWSEVLKVDLIISTGGTGVAPRDVTPEAVKEVIQKEVIGLTIQIITESLKVTPMAMLSRPICGIRAKTLILSLPGSRKASQECLGFVAPSIPHAIELLKNEKTRIEQTHAVVQNAKQEQARHCCYKENRCESTIDSDGKVLSKVDVSRVAERLRSSAYPMISVDTAQKEVLSVGYQLPPQRIEASHSLGFCLAENVHAEESLPPFPASIKDGYAVVSADGQGNRLVVGESFAGLKPQLREVKSGTCMRINTGAPIPPGADAVVQVEDTQVMKKTPDGKEEIEVLIQRAPSKGQDIRPIGCDISQNELLLKSGVLIGPPEIGLLASAGVTHVTVYKKPLVGVLSTGDELQEPFTKPLKSGQIYDSNKVTLMSLLNQHNIPSFDAGSTVDSPTELLKTIREALGNADILVTSGGVSMGDRDILKQILISDLEAEIRFAQVFMKPGKPTTFATCLFNGKLKLIMCLPGNPVSAIVTAHLYLLPLCKKMSGFAHYENRVIKAKLATQLTLDNRPEYHRALISWTPDDDLPRAHSTGNQLSSRLLSMASAQALLKLPSASAERKALPAGSIVEAILLNL